MLVQFMRKNGYDKCAMLSNSSTREKIMIATRSTNDIFRLEIQTWCRMQTLNVVNIFVTMCFLLLQDTSDLFNATHALVAINSFVK